MASNHLDPARGHSVASEPSPGAKYTPELKVYQFFVFCIPILFTFVLLFLFYLFYLRRRRADWSSIRMRTSQLNNDNNNNNININIPTSDSDVGLKKEFREMLPIIVYNETFFVNDNQCSVCLVEYKTEDKLQKIPACGHVFHMDCIDHWLSKHITCPLCRLSVLSSSSSSSIPSRPSNLQVDIEIGSSNNGGSEAETHQNRN